MLVVITVIITSLTGHLYVVALAFAEAIDRLSMEALTVITATVVIVLEIIGMNTTLMALVVGYIYGRRIEDTFVATMARQFVPLHSVLLRIANRIVFWPSHAVKPCEQCHSRNNLARYI